MTKQAIKPRPTDTSSPEHKLGQHAKRLGCTCGRTSRQGIAPTDCASAPKLETGLHIRWLTRRDMADVLQIQTERFENEGPKFLWTEQEFLRCLSRRNCSGVVAEHDNSVIGFMIYELYTTTPHLLNLAIADGFRRRGAGSQLLIRLIERLNPRRTCLLVKVRESNLPAQFFFRASGFRAVSVLRNFFDDTTEDAYLMQFRLPVPPFSWTAGHLPSVSRRF